MKMHTHMHDDDTDVTTDLSRNVTKVKNNFCICPDLDTDTQASSFALILLTDKQTYMKALPP